MDLPSLSPVFFHQFAIWRDHHGHHFLYDGAAQPDVHPPHRSSQGGPDEVPPTSGTALKTHLLWLVALCCPKIECWCWLTLEWLVSNWYRHRTFVVRYGPYSIVLTYLSTYQPTCRLCSLLGWWWTRDPRLIAIFGNNVVFAYQHHPSWRFYSFT